LHFSGLYQVEHVKVSALARWWSRSKRHTLRRQAEQIVRFARPNILFYDEQISALYHRIFALYRTG
jgi:hypothetical protein